MATVSKDFKVKNGLIVEGTNAKVNNYDILTKKPDDQTYIIGLIGGSATPDATPDTVVLRDENADFSANMITADLTGDVTGTVSDISNHSTSDLSEGTNQYFTDTRAKDAVSAALGDGIEYEAGSFNVQIATGLVLGGGTGNEIEIDRTTVDTWYDAAGAASAAQTAAESYADGLASNYDPAGSAAAAQLAAEGYADGLASNYDAAGSASTVQGNLDDHTSATSAHGVTGDIVGTTDTQTLTNKTIGDNLVFNNGTTSSTIGADGEHLVVTGETDLNLVASNGDIVLSADGGVYVGSASAENEIATHLYVDNAVSGLSWKQAVNLKSDSNVNIAGDFVGVVIDGHGALDTNDGGYRLLLTGQSTSSENGIYELTVDGATLLAARAADSDTYQELIGAAVYVMEGTQYGSTSWVQGNHYITDFTGQSWTQFSGQGSVTAGSGITVDGLEVSIDRTTVDTWYDAAGSAATAEDNANTYTDNREIAITTAYEAYADQAELDAVATANGYTDDEITTALSTAQGYANTAEQNAKDYADGLDTDDVAEGSTNLYFTNQRAIDAVGGTIEDAIDLIDTDDIEEGATNLYHTSARAKSAAAELLTGASLTNITITGDGTGLVITAENGVADSDTDDLTEGTTNLYFTDERAVDALEAVVPNFTEVDINSLATQIAATVSVPTASANNVAYSFAKADYRSAEFLVKTAYATHTEISKVLLTLDTSDNIAITEYGIIGTNGASMTISADIDGANVRLLVTTLNNSSTVTVVGTLLA
jgi:hypothetical protein